MVYQSKCKLYKKYGTFTIVGYVNDGVLTTSVTGSFNAIRLNHNISGSGYTYTGIRLEINNDIPTLVPAGYTPLEFIESRAAFVFEPPDNL